MAEAQGATSLCGLDICGSTVWAAELNPAVPSRFCHSSEARTLTSGRSQEKPMRKNLRHLLAGALCAALAACGGAQSDGTLTPEQLTAQLQAAVPSFNDLALGVTEGDLGAPAAPMMEPGVAPDGAAAQVACHPHLFSRTAEVLGNLNVLGYKFLFHVGDLIGGPPSASSTNGRTWHSGRGGIDRRLVVTKSADGSISWELDFAPKPAASSTPSWTKVAWGTVVFTPANASSTPPTAGEKKGTAEIDFTALKTIVPLEPESGQVAWTFDAVKDPTKPAPGRKQAIDVGFTSFKLYPNDPHGARNGTYHYLAEPRVGGIFSFQDTLVLLCPKNDGGQAADTVTESRWYQASDGSVHGRVDAKAVDSQGSTWIPATDTWVGVTCHEGPSPKAENESGYWMMKLEDQNGATVQGSAMVANMSTSTCDTLLGAKIPDLVDSANDWTFGGTLSFPNEW
jgi:hypothetical protein